MATDFAAPGLDLTSLKARLANLGVDVVAPKASPQKAQYPSALALAASPGPVKGANARGVASGLSIEGGKRDVADLLDRVHRVEKAISSAEAQAAAAQQAVTEEIIRTVSPPPLSRSPKADKGKKANVMRQSAPNPTAKGLVAAVRSAGHMKSVPSHTPLSTVLSQFKEAEEAWAHEKARLRREALSERKRANKTDLDHKRIERLAEHRILELKALKTALKNRDSQLQVAEGRIRDLEGALVRIQEDSSCHLSALNAERDDLKALLLATLQRLEAVDEVVCRADKSSAMMEEKMRALEDERLRALEAAARARSEVTELTESRRKLQWQSKLLEKMSEVQLKHNKRKSEAIKRLLHADEGGRMGADQLAALGLDDFGDE